LKEIRRMLGRYLMLSECDHERNDRVANYKQQRILGLSRSQDDLHFSNDDNDYALLNIERNTSDDEYENQQRCFHRCRTISCLSIPYSLWIVLLIGCCSMTTTKVSGFLPLLTSRTYLTHPRMTSILGARRKMQDSIATSRSQKPGSSAILQQVLPPKVTTKDRERAVEALQQQQHQKMILSSQGGTPFDSFLYSRKTYAADNDDVNSNNMVKAMMMMMMSRPTGRPEMVPGAMKHETLNRYRQQQQNIGNDKRSAYTYAMRKESNVLTDNSYQLNMNWDTEVASLSQQSNSGDTLQSLSLSTPASSIVPKRGRGRPKKTSPSLVDGSQSDMDTKKLYSSSETALIAAPTTSSVLRPPPPTRKKVVKQNLPASRVRTAVSAPATLPLDSNYAPTSIISTDVLASTDEAQTYHLNAKRRKSTVAADLQKYYRTELLTAKEEYSLGTKVQLMVRCENVHEGLALRLERLPSMVEWAHACGYVRHLNSLSFVSKALTHCIFPFSMPRFRDHDPTFRDREAYSELRPHGCDDMFQVKDPNLFVGNGLASELGVGRGRGRAKKSPLERLPDFYDDTENKFRPHGSQRIRPALLNRGTVSDFVAMLMDARDAKQRMVSSNMRLVLSISRKYANVGVNIQDLVQEGSLGLSRAVEKFEPRKGFKFSTYASWWIQQAVFRSIAYHSRTIRLPVHVHNLLNRIRKIRKSLEQELGRPPTGEEMAKQMDMSVAKYNKMMRLTRRSISLETPKYQQNPKDFGHEGDDLLRDTIDSAQLFPDEGPNVDRNLLHADLREMLTILEPDERVVLSLRYGLDDGLTRTVTSVASQLQRPKAWVRSQECRALRKLRRPWYEKRLKEHQNSLLG
jgi:RNA polymerase sigma factor (sigma-70 family)